MFFKKFKIDKEYADAIAKASTMGLHMVTHIFVGGVMGYFLDRWLDTKPTLLLIFLCLGAAAGFKSVYLDTKRMLKQMKGPDA